MATTLKVICCLLMLCTHVSSERGWISTPGTIHLCEGDNATFTWLHAFTEEITSIYLTNGKTERTIMFYDTGNHGLKKYDSYVDRTIRVQHSERRTSIQLEDVVKDDSVGYILELAGPGSRDVAHLSVYNENDLKVKVLVDNKPIQEYSNATDAGDEVLFAVEPNPELPSNVTIASVGGDITCCTHSILCTSVVRRDQAEDLTITVDYGICLPLKITPWDIWPPLLTDRSHKKPVVAIVLVMVSIAVVAVAILLIVIFRKKIKGHFRKSGRFSQHEDDPETGYSVQERNPLVSGSEQNSNAEPTCDDNTSDRNLSDMINQSIQNESTRASITRSNEKLDTNDPPQVDSQNIQRNEDCNPEQRQAPNTDNAMQDSAYHIRLTKSGSEINVQVEDYTKQKDEDPRQTEESMESRISLIALSADPENSRVTETVQESSFPKPQAQSVRIDNANHHQNQNIETKRRRKDDLVHQLPAVSLHCQTKSTCIISKEACETKVVNDLQSEGKDMKDRNVHETPMVRPSLSSSTPMENAVIEEIRNTRSTLDKRTEDTSNADETLRGTEYDAFLNDAFGVTENDDKQHSGRTKTTSEDHVGTIAKTEISQEYINDSSLPKNILPEGGSDLVKSHDAETLMSLIQGSIYDTEEHSQKNEDQPVPTTIGLNCHFKAYPPPNDNRAENGGNQLFASGDNVNSYSENAKCSDMLVGAKVASQMNTASKATDSDWPHNDECTSSTSNNLPSDLMCIPDFESNQAHISEQETATEETKLSNMNNSTVHTNPNDASESKYIVDLYSPSSDFSENTDIPSSGDNSNFKNTEGTEWNVGTDISNQLSPVFIQPGVPKPNGGRMRGEARAILDDPSPDSVLSGLGVTHESLPRKRSLELDTDNIFPKRARLQSHNEAQMADCAENAISSEDEIMADDDSTTMS